MKEPLESTSPEFGLNVQESIDILHRLWLLGPGVASDLWIDFDEAGSPSYRIAIIRDGGKLFFMLENFPGLNDPEFIRSVSIQVEWKDPNSDNPDGVNSNYISLLNNLMGDSDNTKAALVAKSLKLIEQMLSRRPNNAA